MGRGSCFCGRGWIYGRGQLRVGQDCWLSPGVIVYTHVEAPVVIGERCDIGPGVEFITGTHRIGDAFRRAGSGMALPISVGDGTWIGAGSRVMPGVNIGPGVIVAAGAVVIRDVPGGTMVAGVPATPKKILA